MQLRNHGAVSVVYQIRCDRCGKRPERGGFGFAEMMSINADAGYIRFLATGNRVEVDLCEACLRDTLGAWLGGPGQWQTRPWRPSWQHSAGVRHGGSSLHPNQQPRIGPIKATSSILPARRRTGPDHNLHVVAQPSATSSSSSY